MTGDCELTLEAWRTHLGGCKGSSWSSSSVDPSRETHSDDLKSNCSKPSILTCPRWCFLSCTSLFLQRLGFAKLESEFSNNLALANFKSSQSTLGPRTRYFESSGGQSVGWKYCKLTCRWCTWVKEVLDETPYQDLICYKNHFLTQFVWGSKQTRTCQQFLPIDSENLWTQSHPVWLCLFPFRCSEGTGTDLHNYCRTVLPSDSSCSTLKCRSCIWEFDYLRILARLGTWEQWRHWWQIRTKCRLRIDLAAHNNPSFGCWWGLSRSIRTGQRTCSSWRCSRNQISWGGQSRRGDLEWPFYTAKVCWDLASGDLIRTDLKKLGPSLRFPCT